MGGIGGAGVGRAAEFAGLYLGLPLVLAFLLPPEAVFPMLAGATLIAMWLLHKTPGFAWPDLTCGWRVLYWKAVAGFGTIAALVAGGLVWWLVSDQALMLPRRASGLWLMILALDPLVSALPQEIVVRPLFNHRYGGLFSGRHMAVAVNAVVFSLAHLMYWNWVALGLTLAGGLVFSLAYLRHGFALAVVLHAVAGGILFTSGLGVCFYHGVAGGGP
jgi:hypothetical protein